MAKSAHKKPEHHRGAADRGRAGELEALAVALGVPRFAARLAGARRLRRMTLETRVRHCRD